MAKIEPGCLAVTCRMVLPEDNGIVVEVIRRYLPQDNAWLVRFLRPVNVWTGEFWIGKRSGELVALESNLRPIGGVPVTDDVHDEVTA